MEDILRFIIKKDYKNLESSIKNLEVVGDDEYNKMTHIFLFMYIHQHIDNEQLFCYLYLIEEKVSIYNKLNFVNNTLLILKNKKCQIAYEYYIIKKNIMMTTFGINEIIKKINDIRGHKFGELTESSFHKFIFGQLTELCSSYADCRFIDLIMNGELNPNLIAIHENQLKERLQMIVKLFGIKLLKFLSVPVLAGIDFEGLSFTEKLGFYKLCVNKLMQSCNTLRNMDVKLYRLQDKENDFSLKFNIIVNPVSSNDESVDDLPITGFANIDTMLNDLVGKYFKLN